jgi:hypothetical protein
MRVLPVVVLALAAAGAGPQQGSIPWQKLEEAKALSGQTGKLILVHVACDPRTGMTPNCGGSERTFSDPAVLKRLDDFYFVRLCDRKTAQELRATRAMEAIFIDGDGDEVSRAGFNDARSLEAAMGAALQRYSPREVPWASTAGKVPAPNESEKRPTALLFVDERKDSQEFLKALEDRTLVKYHERFLFVKLPWKRDSEEARRAGVAQAPTLVFLAPGKGEGVDRLSGRKAPRELKAAFQKMLGKLERK